MCHSGGVLWGEGPNPKCHPKGVQWGGSHPHVPFWGGSMGGVPTSCAIPKGSHGRGVSSPCAILGGSREGPILMCHSRVPLGGPYPKCHPKGVQWGGVASSCAILGGSQPQVPSQGGPMGVQWGGGRILMCHSGVPWGGVPSLCAIPKGSHGGGPNPTLNLEWGCRAVAAGRAGRCRPAVPTAVTPHSPPPPARPTLQPGAAELLKLECSFGDAPPCR